MNRSNLKEGISLKAAFFPGFRKKRGFVHIFVVSLLGGSCGTIHATIHQIYSSPGIL